MEVQLIVKSFLGIVANPMILVSFILIAFFSINFANGLAYSAIFISNLSRKKYIDLLTIFLVSVFWDIYSFAFIGINQITMVIFYILSSRYRPAFPNFKINTGYLFLFLCYAKLLSLIIINFLGYSYDTHSNVMQIFWSLLVYWTYYFSRIIRDGVSDA